MEVPRLGLSEDFLDYVSECKNNQRDHVFMKRLRGLATKIFLHRFSVPRDLCRWAFRHYGERLAFMTTEGERLTFAELGARVYGLAAGLLARGLQAGDRVAFLLPNSLEFVELRLACHEASLTAMPLVWDLSPEARVRALSLTEAQMYAFDPELDRGAAETASRGIPELRCVPVIRGDRRSIESLSSAGAGPSRVPIDPMAPATIHFTSGTTGEPKGVVSTHGAWVSSLKMTVGSSRLTPGKKEVMLHAIPFATAGWGAVLPSLLGGVTGLLMRRFEPGLALEFAEREQATRAFLTPSQIIDWLDEPTLGSSDLSTLGGLIYGTAPLHGPKAAEALRRFGPKLQQGYGLAEVLPPVALLWPEEHDPAGHPFRAGRPVRGVEIRIVDSDGSEVASGDRGQVGVESRTCTRATGAGRT